MKQTKQSWEEKLEKECEINQDFSFYSFETDSVGDDLKNFISKTIEEEKQAWIEGKRCTNCGKIKEIDLANWCKECFDNE